MTNNELTTWRMIGADMGLEFDELGHPFKPGQVRDGVTLEFYAGAYDWRPLDDDSDCLGLMLHYHLTVTCEREGVMVRESSGPILTMQFYSPSYPHEETVRRAVFESAAKIVRAKLARLDQKDVPVEFE